MIKLNHRLGEDLHGAFSVTVFSSTLRLQDVNHALIFSHLANFWKKLTRIDMVSRLEVRDRRALLLQQGVRLPLDFLARLPIEFKASNDLLRPVNGPSGPHLFLLPGAESIFFILDGTAFELGREQAVAELECYGKAVAAAIPDGRHERALELWAKRHDITDAEKITIYGMTQPLINHLKARGVSASWEPYLLAARATSKLSPEVTLSIMDCVHQGGCVPNQNFYAIKKELRRLVGRSRSTIAHEIGYAAAKILRDMVGISEALWPEVLCTDFGIPIIPQELSREIDGLSFATSSRCGILLNPHGIHSSSRQGQKFTILHELGHLLIEFGDLERGNFEVKTKSNHSFFEKICNAFAAEALLPRAELKLLTMEAEHSLTRIHELARRRFSVGDTVTTYQIANDIEILGSLAENDKMEVERQKVRIVQGL